MSFSYGRIDFYFLEVIATQGITFSGTSRDACDRVTQIISGLSEQDFDTTPPQIYKSFYFLSDSRLFSLKAGKFCITTRGWKRIRENNEPFFLEELQQQPGFVSTDGDRKSAAE